MEASTAGPAAANGDAAQADGTEPQAAAEPTLTDIQTSLQGFGSDIEQMREHLAAEPWRPATDGQPQEQQQQQTPAADELDFSFLDETAPQYAGSPEAAMAQLGQLIRGEAKKVAAEEVKPIRTELQQEKQERGYENLAERYPQLQDQKVAKELLDLTAQVVQQEGFPEELALHPGFMEKIYLASRAQAQNQEGGADAAAATLEGAGGASPGGAGQGAAQQQVTGAEYAQSLAPSRLGLFTGG